MIYCVVFWCKYCTSISSIVIYYNIRSDGLRYIVIYHSTLWFKLWHMDVQTCGEMRGKPWNFDQQIFSYVQLSSEFWRSKHISRWSPPAVGPPIRVPWPTKPRRTLTHRRVQFLHHPTPAPGLHTLILAYYCASMAIMYMLSKWNCTLNIPQQYTGPCFRIQTNSASQAVTF